MNGVRHGLRARTVILKGEKPEDFDEILGGLQDEFQPQSASERHLVDQAAIAQWKLVRAEVYERRSYERSYGKDNSVETGSAMFSRMTLVTGRLERTYSRACKELERIKANRAKQAEAAKAAEKSQESNKSQTSGRRPPIDLYWVDPDTGERTLQTPDAKPIEDPTRAEESAEPPTPPD
jgi:hypothetical protein